MMMKKSSLLTILLCLGISSIKAQEKPNILFILADDLGWSDTELYGTTSFYETPNITRLAERGMLFTNAYSANPVCSPTRAGLLTGLDPARIGFTQAAGHLESAVLTKELVVIGKNTEKTLHANTISRLDTAYVTIAEVLKNNGYATGHFGKWHIGNDPYAPLEQGFDVYIPNWPLASGPTGGYLAPYPEIDPDFDAMTPNEHIEDRMAMEAVDFMTTHKDEPFFLNYWAFSVHAPWEAKPELNAKYADKADPNSPQRLPVYAAMIQSFDENVGKLLDAVDNLGIADHTIIVFYSDNGGNMYSQVDNITITSNLPLRNGKASIYEGGSRVPAAVIWPGKITANTQSDAFLSSTDWFPTLLEMTGIEKPAELEFDGYNQVPMFLNGTHVREKVFSHVPHYFDVAGHKPSVYVREGDWKLIRHFNDNFDQSDRLELFNLKEDIGETSNLVNQNPNIVSELNTAIDLYLEEIEAVVPRANPLYGLPYDPTNEWLFNYVNDWFLSTSIESGVADDGKATITIDGGDPYLRYHGDTYIDASTNHYLQYRIKNNATGQSNSTMTFYFKNDLSDNWHNIPLTVSANDTEFKDYFFDISGNPNWQGHIIKVRNDPGGSAGTIEFDYFGIVEEEMDATRNEFESGVQVNALSVEEDIAIQLMYKQLSASAEEAYRYKVYDITGKIVCDSNRNVRNFNIDFNSEAPGIYLLVAHNTNQRIVKKLCIQ